jgi:hypothetical protein
MRYAFKRLLEDLFDDLDKTGYIALERNKM